MSLSKISKVIFINFFIIFIFYLIIEMFSGDLIYKRDIKCSYVLCDAKYSYSTTLYSKDKIQIEYNKDNFGLRGRKNKINEIDILTVGGSTTDERYINLENTWAEKLENLFIKKGVYIDVVNAGIDGQSTYGHIWNFENWFNKIENFKTKYVLFYIGTNEKGYSGRHDLDISKVPYPKKILYILKYNNGITNKIYEFIVHKYNPIDELNVAHSKNRSPNYLKVGNNFNYKFDNLEKNIEKLIELSIKLNSKPIFVTQKTLRWKIVKDEVYSISKNDNYYLKEKKISEIILKACNKYNLICLDGFNGINFNLEDTYDLVHTNPSGSEKIARFIFKEIQSKINY